MSTTVIVRRPVTRVIKISRGPQGIQGSSIVDVGTYNAPTVVTGILTVPIFQRVHMYLKGDTSLRSITAVTNGLGTQELYLLGVDSNFKLRLPKALSNLSLSGEWYGGADSLLYLRWLPVALKWIEVSRNEN